MPSSAPPSHPHSLSRKAVGVIAACTVLGTVVGYFYAQTVPFRYEIEAEVLAQIGRELGSARPEIVGSGGSGNVVTPPRSEQINTEVALLQSTSLIRRTFDELVNEIPGFGQAPRGGGGGPLSVLTSGIRSLTESLELTQPRTTQDRMLENWLNAVDVAPVPRSHVVKVTCKALDPQLGQMFVERWLRLYTEAHVQAYSQADTTPLFEKEATRLREELKKCEQALSDLRLQTGVFDVDATKSQLLERRMDDESRQRDLAAQIAASQAKVAAIETELKRLPEQLELSSVSRSSEIRDYVERMLIDTENAVAQAEAQYIETNEFVVNAREQRDKLREMLATQPVTREDSKTVGRNPVSQSLQQELLQSVATLRAQQAEAEVVKETLAAVDREMVEVESKRGEHEALLRQIQEAKDNLDQVLEGERIGRMNMTLDKALVTNVRVVTPPAIPPSPIKMLGLPHRVSLTLGGALLLGLLSLGFFLVRQALLDARHAATAAGRDVLALKADPAVAKPEAKSDAS